MLYILYYILYIIGSELNFLKTQSWLFLIVSSKCYHRYEIYHVKELRRKSQTMLDKL